jgi:hypothetical protein
MKTGKATLDNGKTIKNTERECISGRTATNMRASINVERGRALELWSMLTDKLMKEIG